MSQLIPPSGNMLQRLNDTKIIAGVCSGIGRYFNLDAVLVRLAWVFFTLWGGAGFMLYLVAWLLMPDQHGKRAATPLVLLLTFFVIVPASCFLLTLPFRIFF